MGDMQTTFVMIKPDGVQRGLVADIIGRFETKGLRMNMGKTKVMVSGPKLDILKDSGQNPCGVCRKGVGAALTAFFAMDAHIGSTTSPIQR